MSTPDDVPDSDSPSVSATVRPGALAVANEHGTSHLSAEELSTTPGSTLRAQDSGSFSDGGSTPVHLPPRRPRTELDIHELLPSSGNTTPSNRTSDSFALNPMLRLPYQIPTDDSLSSGSRSPQTPSFRSESPTRTVINRAAAATGWRKPTGVVTRDQRVRVGASSLLAKASGSGQTTATSSEDDSSYRGDWKNVEDKRLDRIVKQQQERGEVSSSTVDALTTPSSAEQTPFSPLSTSDPTTGGGVSASESLDSGSKLTTDRSEQSSMASSHTLTSASSMSPIDGSGRKSRVVASTEDHQRPKSPSPRNQSIDSQISDEASISDWNDGGVLRRSPGVDVLFVNPRWSCPAPRHVNDYKNCISPELEEMRPSRRVREDTHNRLFGQPDSPRRSKRNNDTAPVSGARITTQQTLFGPPPERRQTAVRHPDTDTHCSLFGPPPTFLRRPNASKLPDMPDLLCHQGPSYRDEIQINALKGRYRLRHEDTGNKLFGEKDICQVLSLTKVSEHKLDKNADPLQPVDSSRHQQRENVHQAILVAPPAEPVFH